MPEKRQLIVVDVETTGLDIKQHWPIEVAAINVQTGEEMYFVPAIPESALATADGDALRINRYFERGVYKQQLKVAETMDRWQQLLKLLNCNTFGGSNPTFDTAMVSKGASWAIGEHSMATGFWNAPSTWHHRLADLAAYAGPAFGLEPHELEGLADVCARLGVDDGEHTALGDARATVECFQKLADEYKQRPLYPTVFSQ